MRVLIFLFISILIVGFDAVSTCKPKLRRYFKIDVLLLNYQNLVGKSLRVFFFLICKELYRLSRGTCSRYRFL